MTYYALFEPEDGWIIVTFPDFGWGVSQGKDEADALSMAADLLDTLITAEIRDGKALPRPKQHRGKKYRPIALPALSTAKVELYNAFRSAGLTRAELGKRAGLGRADVNRLFDLLRPSPFEHIELALRALGKRLTLTVEAA